MENPEKWIFIEGIILQFGDKNHFRYILYEEWTLEIMIDEIVNDLSAKMLSSLMGGSPNTSTWGLSLSMGLNLNIYVLV